MSGHEGAIKGNRGSFILEGSISVSGLKQRIRKGLIGGYSPDLAIAEPPANQRVGASGTSSVWDSKSSFCGLGTLLARRFRSG